jgi:hypothetical protein
MFTTNDDDLEWERKYEEDGKDPKISNEIQHGFRVIKRISSEGDIFLQLHLENTSVCYGHYESHGMVLISPEDLLKIIEFAKQQGIIN